MAYPEYESFTSEWLGKCPKGWRNASTKYCYDIQLGKMLQTKPESSEDVEEQYLKALHVNWNKIKTNDLPLMWASPNDLKKYAVKNGDLLICEGGEVGRSAIITDLEERAIIQNALHRVRNDKLGEIRFLDYMMRHLADIGWFNILCNKATIAHLTGEKLGAIKLPLPTVEEQQKIASFLDYKTQQIDQLIEKKKALIEKLNEQRIAVITQAVTKGIDKNAKMKPSGVDWLGDVPEHWEVKRLKFVASHNDEALSDKTDPNYEIEYIDISSVDLVQGIKNIEPLTFETSPSRARRIVKDGDTIVSTVRTYLKSIATIDNPPKNLVVSTGFAVIRPKEEIDKKYLSYFLQSEGFVNAVVAHSVGVSYPAINASDLVCLPISFPCDIDEQKEIVTYIEKELAQIDKLTSMGNKTIQYYKEYRSALITAAVTGKIDVRNFDIPTH